MPLLLSCTSSYILRTITGICLLGLLFLSDMYIVAIIFTGLAVELLLLKYTTDKMTWRLFAISVIYMLIGLLCAISSVIYQLQFIKMLLVCSFVSDTIAFIAGKYFQGPKLAPIISPNKTIAGVIAVMLVWNLIAIACPQYILATIMYSKYIFTFYAKYIYLTNINIVHIHDYSSLTYIICLISIIISYVLAIILPIYLMRKRKFKLLATIDICTCIIVYILSTISSIAINHEMYFAYFLITFLRISTLIVLTHIITFSTVMGDLLESKVKRILQIKDSSNFLPGHGGFWDRFDSFLGLCIVVYVVYILFS